MLEEQNEQLRAALQQAELERARQKAELETLMRHLLSGVGSYSGAAVPSGNATVSSVVTLEQAREIMACVATLPLY